MHAVHNAARQPGHMQQPMLGLFTAANNSSKAAAQSGSAIYVVVLIAGRQSIGGMRHA